MQKNRNVSPENWKNKGRATDCQEVQMSARSSRRWFRKKEVRRESLSDGVVYLGFSTSSPAAHTSVCKESPDASILSDEVTRF